MPDDRAYLYDMLNAAHKIKGFVGGMTQEQFNASELHQNAVVRLIQVIGEATRLVSEDTRAAHPQIPWRRIAGMRNTLVHRYFNIDLQIVWEVISVDIDELIKQLEPIVGDKPDQPES